MQKIAINSRKTIKAVQEEFNKCFPYLKIEFFSRPHEPRTGSEKKLMMEKYKTLQECRTINHDGVLTINPEMTVADLEQKFDHVYGLSVQVFRKSGKVWLETIQTDGMTLVEQNKLGEAHSKPLDKLDA